MKISTNPAIKGDIIYMMLNPKITKFHFTQIKAEMNPNKNPRTMAVSAQRFSIRTFFREAIKTCHLQELNCS